MTQKKIVAFAVFAGMVAASVAILWRIAPVKRIITGEVPLAQVTTAEFWT